MTAAICGCRPIPRPEPTVATTIAEKPVIAAVSSPLFQLASTIDAHENPITCVAFSADGSVLATADPTGVIKLWNAGSGGEKRAFKERLPVTALALSPDGSETAIAMGNTVTLRVSETGRARRILDAGGAVSCLRYSSDGRQIAAGVRPGSVRFWDASTGRPVYSLTGKPGPPPSADFLHVSVPKVAFSPQGDTLAVLWSEVMATVHDAKTGRERFTISNPAEMLEFSPDGTVLAVRGPDRAVIRYDSASGKGLSPLPPMADEAVGFTSAGNLVAFRAGSALDPNILELIDGRSGASLGVREIAADDDAPHPTAFNPRTNIAAIASGKLVRLWRIPSGK
jgi:WD40 repeat protein